MDKYSINSGTQIVIYHEIPEHEVYLSFNNDSDAHAFVEWFEKNRTDFEKFVDEEFEDF